MKFNGKVHNFPNRYAKDKINGLYRVMGPNFKVVDNQPDNSIRILSDTVVNPIFSDNFYKEIRNNDNAQEIVKSFTYESLENAIKKLQKMDTYVFENYKESNEADKFRYLLTRKYESCKGAIKASEQIFIASAISTIISPIEGKSKFFEITFGDIQYNENSGMKGVVTLYKPY